MLLLGPQNGNKLDPKFMTLMQIRTLISRKISLDYQRTRELLLDAKMNAQEA